MQTKEQKKIWRQWADTLEFGGLKQVQGALCGVSRNEQGEPQLRYCCLGVLCAMHNAATAPKQNNWGPISEVSSSVVEDLEIGITYDGAPSLPPNTVRSWAGFDSKKYDTPLDFASLNDGTGLVFKEIAAVIRECVKQDTQDVSRVARKLFPNHY